MTTFHEWLDEEIAMAHLREREACHAYTTAPLDSPTKDDERYGTWREARAQILALEEVRRAYVRFPASLNELCPDCGYIPCACPDDRTHEPERGPIFLM